MSAFVLKLIAIGTMTLDHLRVVVFPDRLWMSVLGRITMPIMCFLIGEGYHHTHDHHRYLQRLGAFALLSELPFDLCFYGTAFYPWHQNVFFTLFLGLLALHGFEHFRGSWRVGSIFLCAMLASLLHTDYGAYGVFLICGFYLLPQHSLDWCLLMLLLELLFDLGQLQIYALLAIPLLVQYNGQRGPGFKWWFYLYYPVHLLLLSLF